MARPPPLPAGRSGYPEPAPSPTCPGRPASDYPRSPILDSTRLRAELGGAGEEGASGRLQGLGRLRVRYCSLPDSRSPQGAGGTTPGLQLPPNPPAPPSCGSFSPPQLLGGPGGGMLEFGQTSGRGSSWSRKRGARPPSTPSSAQDGGYPP